MSNTYWEFDLEGVMSNMQFEYYEDAQDGADDAWAEYILDNRPPQDTIFTNIVTLYEIDADTLDILTARDYEVHYEHYNEGYYYDRA